MNDQLDKRIVFNCDRNAIIALEYAFTEAQANADYDRMYDLEEALDGLKRTFQAQLTLQQLEDAVSQVNDIIETKEDIKSSRA